MSRSTTRRLLSIVVALYAAARVAQAFPDRVPMLLVVALHVLLPLIFAIVHGSAVYRLRDILVFMLLCFTIGNLTENLSILTGFPFGHYYFTDVMGPKLFNVPVLLGLAYIGMGYVSWIVGSVILDSPGEPFCRSRIRATPLFAAFVMVAWDFAQEPVWANLVHAWVWRDGGPYFGVPVSNFFGWYLTVYLIYQSFALYLRRRPAAPEPLPIAFRRLPVLMYGICAAGNVFVVAAPHQQTVADATGAQWRVADIFGVSLLASIFVMGAFAVAAWIRVSDSRAASPR